MAKRKNKKSPSEQPVDLDDLDVATLKSDVSPEDNSSVAALSDVGMVRELNEDTWHWAKLDDNMTLYAVADGMGGHDAGEVAAQLAVETLFSASRQALEQTEVLDSEGLGELLRHAFEQANQLVVSTGMAQESNMGTTLCAILANDNGDIIAGNVGDSRVYLLREGKLQQISRDHSLVAFLVQLGELTSEEARDHPSGNILVRSIGSVPDIEVDVFQLKSQTGDRFILCSDGLWGEITDEELLLLLMNNEDPKDACAALIETANGNGGRDNSTLIVVNV